MKNFLPICIIILCLLLPSGIIKAQSNTHAVEEALEFRIDSSHLNHVGYYGGGSLSAALGHYWMLGASPEFGYRFNQYFALGGTVGYYFSNELMRQPPYAWRHVDQYFIAGLYARFFASPYIFVQVQPQIYYDWQKTEFSTADIPNSPYRGDMGEAFLIGLGFQKVISKHTTFVLLTQYDLLQLDTSPYRSNRIMLSAGIIVDLK